MKGNEGKGDEAPPIETNLMYNSHASFSFVFSRALSFLLACIRDPASNCNLFNIIVIVTGVEIVIGNCLPEVHKILSDFRN